MNRIWKAGCLAAGLLCAAGAWAELAPGDVIYIATDNTYGSSVLADGHTWNKYDYNAVSDRSLLLADGSNEGVTAHRLSAAGLNWSLNSTAVSNLTTLSWVPADFPPDAANVTTNGETISFRIQGLSGSFQYNVKFAAAQSSASYENEAVTVNGLGTTGSAAYNPYANRQGQAVNLEWLNVSLDGEGYLVISITGSASERPTAGVYRIEVSGSAPAPKATAVIIF